jgi:hypothetical protein
MGAGHYRSRFGLFFQILEFLALILPMFGTFRCTFSNDWKISLPHPCGVLLFEIQKALSPMSQVQGLETPACFAKSGDLI